jgi:CBS domain-containing protein
MATSAGNARTPQSVGSKPDPSALLTPETAVSWIMNREVVSVRPDFLLTSLEGLLVSQDLSRVPVIDDSGKLLGVVSKTDLVTHHLDKGDAGQEAQARVAGRRGVRQQVPAGFHQDEESGDTVAEVMCQTVLTVTQETSIARAAELMAVHKVHGLPVVGADGKVIGWLSSLDILSWVAGINS